MLILATCNDTVQMCCNMAPFLKIVKLLIMILQFSIPAVLIILGSIDLFRAITGDQKVASEVTKNFAKRLAYALIIFVVPFLIRTILELIENSVPKTEDDDLPGVMAWVSCWNNIAEGSYCKACEDIYDYSDTNPNGNGNSGSSSSGSSDNSEDSGSGTDSEGEKVCYAWKYANCENKNLNTFSYAGVASISAPKYNSSDKVCKVTVQLEENQAATADFCSTMCPYIGFFEGNNENKGTCACSYKAKEETRSAATAPKESLDGNVDTYSCSETTSCDAVEFVTGGACTGPTGTKNVSKQ